MTWANVERLGADAVSGVGATHVRAVTERLANGWPQEAVLRTDPGMAELLDALDTVEQGPALSYLRGLAVGYERRAGETSVESVWSGPGSHRVPVRAMGRVLTSLATEARAELVLTNHSAKPYPPVIEALTVAGERGVAVRVVVETMQGAGSAPARAAEHIGALCSNESLARLW